MNAPPTLLELLQLIDGQLAAAERALVAATGGQNICRLDKNGGDAGGAKYDEGRLVALRAARRLLQSSDPPQAFTQLQRLRAQWREDLRTQQQRERPSPPWLAYTQGGTDKRRCSGFPSCQALIFSLQGRLYRHRSGDGIAGTNKRFSA